MLKRIKTTSAMFQKLKHLSNTRRSIAIIIVIVAMAITFETFQQLFYIKRFQPELSVTFSEILQTQVYRWLIWLILSVVLVWYSKVNISKPKTPLYFFNISLLIIGLVFLNIIIISLISILTSGDVFSVSDFFTEYLPFFMYQKSPIYILGYIAISMILYLYFENEKLQIEVQELSELKLTNARLFKKLSATNGEKTTVLNIKIGNKHKIIPVSEISWIEADDYCVRVHTKNNGSYTMRSTLKALEEKLSVNFLRVHRKALVNMTFAKELHISGSPNLILEDNMQIPVSKSNLKTVREFLN